MSLAFTLSLERDDATPHLMRLGQAVLRPDVRIAMGRAIATRLRAHFSQLDSGRANGMGGKRTHFYEQARDAVQQPELVGGDGVKVAINHVGIAQRYFGGDIEPVNGNWLAIPARAEAYGHRATEFSDLHFVLFRSTLAGLVQTEGDTGRKSIDRDGEGGGIFYWLVKRVHQEPDPDVLPGDDELRDEAAFAGEDRLQTLNERAAA